MLALHRGTTPIRECLWQHPRSVFGKAGAELCGSTRDLNKRLVCFQMHGGDPVHEHAPSHQLGTWSVAQLELLPKHNKSGFTSSLCLDTNPKRKNSKEKKPDTLMPSALSLDGHTCAPQKKGVPTCSNCCSA